MGGFTIIQMAGLALIAVSLSLLVLPGTPAHVTNARGRPRDRLRRAFPLSVPLIWLGVAVLGGLRSGRSRAGSPRSCCRCSRTTTPRTSCSRGSSAPRPRSGGRWWCSPSWSARRCSRSCLPRVPLAGAGGHRSVAVVALVGTTLLFAVFHLDPVQTSRCCPSRCSSAGCAGSGVARPVHRDPPVEQRARRSWWCSRRPSDPTTSSAGRRPSGPGGDDRRSGRARRLAQPTGRPRPSLEQQLDLATEPVDLVPVELRRPVAHLADLALAHREARSPSGRRARGRRPPGPSPTQPAEPARRGCSACSVGMRPGRPPRQLAADGQRLLPQADLEHEEHRQHLDREQSEVEQERELAAVTSPTVMSPFHSAWTIIASASPPTPAERQRGAAAEPREPERGADDRGRGRVHHRAVERADDDGRPTPPRSPHALTKYSRFSVIPKPRPAAAP